MTDFCKGDPRLLPTAYVPLVDFALAAETARQAIALGAKALMIPSRCPPGHSPSHIGFDPLWAIAQEAGLPILFHVGGEEKMQDDYAENGLPRVKDFRGVNPNAFDGHGNYSLGLTEQIIFPEIDYDKIEKVSGLNVAIVTTAPTDQEARSLLKQLGMPFKR